MDVFILKTLLLVKTGSLELARAHVEAVYEQMDRPVDIAMLYAIINDPERAFYWIEKAIDGHYREALLLKTWEMFDPLRSDPRFVDALIRAGFSG